MQIRKSFGGGKTIFKEYFEIKKWLFGCELWGDGSFIGNLNNSATSDVI